MIWLHLQQFGVVVFFLSVGVSVGVTSLLILGMFTRPYFEKRRREGGR